MVKEIIFVSATKLGENNQHFCDCSTLFFINEFSLKNSKLCRRSFLHNTIFINSLVSFHKKKKITEHLFKYVHVLIENILFKTKNTESTKRRKTSFPK